MSVENVQAFFIEIQDNEAVQQTLESVGDRGGFEAMAVQLGQERGYEFSADEVGVYIDAVKAALQNGELTDDDLDGVYGGVANVNSEALNPVMQRMIMAI